MDQKMEQQVWQRVLGQAQLPSGDLRALELAALEAAAVYRKLSGRFTGRSRETLRRLYDVQTEAAACLKGMERLSGGAGKPARVSPPEEPAEKALEKRYHCACRAITEYTARTVDGEFGAVFQHLAELSRTECVLLAGLLGEMPHSGG